MKRIPFNEKWQVSILGKQGWLSVDVPYDALFHETRSFQSLGSTNTGYYFAHDYRYRKDFEAPKEWAEKSLILDFEGVCHQADVILNGDKIACHEYGFTEFFVDIAKEIKIGEKNVLEVICHCADEPNCRWYPGGGILRPVSLLVGEKEHLLPYEVEVRALSVNPSVIVFSLPASKKGINVEILDKGGKIIATKANAFSKGTKTYFQIENAHLWSPEDPYLYSYRLVWGLDVTEGRFGLRTLAWGDEGLLLNGKRMILRGGCLHSDNGLLGGVSSPYSERRKIRLLKESGYNALRSAHNPCDKALLDAADEMGLLVMDELYDNWYVHKTHHDYGDYFEKNWKLNLEEMVRKDFNHPSVILYSLGNEAAETSEKKGIALMEEMGRYLKALDQSRPITMGVNAFFNCLYSLGLGVYSDKKAKEAETDFPKKKAVGSEFFNVLAGAFGAGFMKAGASLIGSDLKTRGVFSKLDLAGYNYGIKRYKKDLRKYPHRLILGTETFISDLPRAMALMKKNPRIIGDFSWSAMDYLGEVGIGAWLYPDYAPDFKKGLGWISAGIGCLDLTGKPTCESLFTRVAFGLDPLALGVVPPRYYGQKHSPSAWRFTSALNSWAFPGEEGKKCLVEVYSLAPKVRLFINDEKILDKKTHNGIARFVMKYRNGLLSATNLDAKGREQAKTFLSSLSGTAKLVAKPEASEIRITDLAYIRFSLEDDKGTVDTSARCYVSLCGIKGGTLLAFGSACPFNKDSFFGSQSDTYFGECLAIIKPKDSGTISVNATSPYGNAACKILVKGRPRAKKA